MNINDHQLDLILNINNKNNNHSRNYNNKIEQNSDKIIHSILLDLAKVYSIEIKKQWFQIEFLSLRNSLIKNIDFIINMPNLYYLDLYQNPIESFSTFSISNSFGYLCFSPPPNYFEQKILSIEKLNTIFVLADIKDLSIKKTFLQKNPNIMVLNNDIIDFNYKIKLFSLNQGQKNNDLDIKSNNEEDKISLFLEKNNAKIDTFYANKFKVKNKEGCTNKKILDIENLIRDYNKRMLYFQKDGKINYNQLKVNIEEKRKLIAITDCYLNILELNNPNNNSYYKYIPVKEKKDINLLDNSSVHYEIDLNIFKNFTIPSLKEFLLSIFILYIFKILSKDISFELLRLILLKSHYYLENKERRKNLDKDIINILNLDSNLLLCLYYKIYDIFFGVFSNKRLSDMQVKLQMNEITDKIMDVMQHQNNFIKMMESNSDPFKKGVIIRNELILYLNQNDIFNNILMIIQYVDDYIIYNSIQKKLALKNSKDLQFFINIKNHMYFSLDKKNEKIQSMAEKKYIKTQMKSLFNNKYFFDTENYMKTNQFFMNVFLNYKHGVFYPNKNKIKKIKNNEIEEELKNKEKEKIKKLYVQNNLKSFFNIIKEKNQIKLNKNVNTLESHFTNPALKKNFKYKNKICGNEINIKLISNLTSSNYFNNNNYNKNKIKNNINIRKIDNIDFELVKKGQDKFYKTLNNFQNISTENNISKGINFDFYSHKKIKIKQNKINNDINNINTNHKMYNTAINIAKNNNIDNNKLEYLRFNSMNEVLNNLDLTNKDFFLQLKNIFDKKKNNKNSNRKKKIKLKSQRINYLIPEKKNSHKKEKNDKNHSDFYFNKTLGCKINCQKIVLSENENKSEEGNPNDFSLNNALSSIKINKNRKIKYIKSKEKIINSNSNSEYGKKIRIYN